MHPDECGLGRACVRPALPCARVGDHGYPEWVHRPRFDEHLATSNAVTARVGEAVNAAPIPYSRWIEQVNREDRFEPARASGHRPGEPSRYASSPMNTTAGPDGAHAHQALVSSPRLGDLLPHPPIVRAEQVKRAYSPSPVLPRGMTMDVLA
jgi:hypothetical protein